MNTASPPTITWVKSTPLGCCCLCHLPISRHLCPKVNEWTPDGSTGYCRQVRLCYQRIHMADIFILTTAYDVSLETIVERDTLQPINEIDWWGSRRDKILEDHQPIILSLSMFSPEYLRAVIEQYGGVV